MRTLLKLKSPTGGFSVIEMLVATVVFSLGVMGLAAMTYIASRGQDQTTTHRMAALNAANIITRLMNNGMIDFNSGTGETCAAGGASGSFGQEGAGNGTKTFNVCGGTVPTKYSSASEGEPEVEDNPTGNGHLNLDGTRVYLYWVACQLDPTPGHTTVLSDSFLCDNSIDVENGPFPEGLTCQPDEVDAYITSGLAMETAKIALVAVYRDQNRDCHTWATAAVVKTEDIGTGGGL